MCKEKGSKEERYNKLRLIEMDCNENISQNSYDEVLSSFIERVIYREKLIRRVVKLLTSRRIMELKPWFDLHYIYLIRKKRMRDIIRRIRLKTQIKCIFST